MRLVTDRGDPQAAEWVGALRWTCGLAPRCAGTCTTSSVPHVIAAGPALWRTGHGLTARVAPVHGASRLARADLRAFTDHVGHRHVDRTLDPADQVEPQPP